MIRCVALLAFVFTTACDARPAPNAEVVPHPEDATSKIEYFVEEPEGDGPWATVIFLHGHQPLTQNVGGRAFADWDVLSRFADKGYLAVSVSLPGYGNSTGPRDFAGLRTQRAVTKVIEHLEDQNRAIPDKVVIQGMSLGAVTAALIGVQNEDLAGLVLISGLYDLPSFFKGNNTEAAQSIRAAAVAQTGGDVKALMERSALSSADRIKADTLILNGAVDDRTDANQARRMAAQIVAGGGNAEVYIFPEAGHQIPVGARNELIDPFIERVLSR